MTLKYNKVNLATIDEFKSFCSNNPNIKYIDAILTDLSGIIREKDCQLRMQKSYLNLEYNFVIQHFY